VRKGEGTCRNWSSEKEKSIELVFLGRKPFSHEKLESDFSAFSKFKGFCPMIRRKR
jgi:hypothetical protein